MIRESTKLTANSLINYSRLPTKSNAISDKNTGEFMFIMKRRAGCPISEHELKKKLTECLYAIVDELNIDRSRRRTIIDSAKNQKPEVIGSVIHHIIAQDR